MHRGGAHLYSRLLLTSLVVIPTPDPLGHLFPQPPALPRTLPLDRLDLYFFLGRARVQEQGPLGTTHVRRAGPLAFVRLDRLGVRSAIRGRDGRFERVGLARKVPAALVVDLRGEGGRGLDGRSLGQFDVGRAPDDAFDAELGYRGQLG